MLSCALLSTLAIAGCASMATTYRVVDKSSLDSIKTVYVALVATNITAFSRPWSVSPTLALAKELDGRNLFSVMHLDSAETLREDSVSYPFTPNDAFRLAKTTSSDAFIYARINYIQECFLNTPFGPIFPMNSFNAGVRLYMFKTSNGKLLAEFSFSTATGDPWTDQRQIDTMTVHVIKGVVDAVEGRVLHARKSVSSSK
jgi:hypothetical protein